MSTAPFDVVVVGSGAAALFCAIAACEMGLTCAVLEKAEKFGGGTAISAGTLWIGANHLFDAAGGNDSEQEAADYLRYVGASGVSPAKMHTFVREGHAALRFFETCGLPFRITPFVDHYYGVAPGGKTEGRIVELPPISANELGPLHDSVLLPAGKFYRMAGTETLACGGVNSAAAWDMATTRERDAPDLRAGGAGLVTWLLKLAIARGVTLRRNTPVERLLYADGRVRGVATTGGGQVIARRGVVIASGGYESNAAMVESYEALPGWQSMFPESLTGDGLVMATRVGAAVDMISNNLAVFLGFRNPDERPGGTSLCRLSGIQELVAPHTMVVNRAGQRFADETFFQALAPSLRVFDPRSRVQPNLPCFLIFDSAYAARHSFAGRPPGAPIPDWVPRAGTLAALAERLGICTDGLTATSARFNRDSHAGQDSAFHRGETAWGQLRFRPGQTLGALETPPFFGIELHPTALGSAGVRTDCDARALDMRDEPIDGLFAIGNAAARKETGSGYQTGFSLGSAMTFGLIAARAMADTHQEAQ